MKGKSWTAERKHGEKRREEDLGGRGPPSLRRKGGVGGGVHLLPLRSEGRGGDFPKEGIISPKKDIKNPVGEHGGGIGEKEKTQGEEGTCIPKGKGRKSLRKVFSFKKGGSFRKKRRGVRGGGPSSTERAPSVEK